MRSLLCRLWSYLRPLAGMLLKLRPWSWRWARVFYRPLAGIKCFWPGRTAPSWPGSYRPLAGIKCFFAAHIRQNITGLYRPLAGINCFGKQLQISACRGFQILTVFNKDIPYFPPHYNNFAEKTAVSRCKGAFIPGSNIPLGRSFAPYQSSPRICRFTLSYMVKSSGL